MFTHIQGSSREMFWAKSAWLKYLCERSVVFVTSFSAQNDGYVWKWSDYSYYVKDNAWQGAVASGESINFC